MFEYEETRKQVESLLQVKLGEMEDDDNLIEFGINSLKIMRLVNIWRKKGAKVTFAKLISNPTFSEWWKMISEVNIGGKENKILPLPQQIGEKQYPLTDVQYAYWIGRREGQVLGNIGCHAYLEIDTQDIQLDQLQRAWQQLIKQHPALRTRFTEEGKQEVLQEAPFKHIVYHDMKSYSKAEIEKSLNELRSYLSHRKLRIEEGENAGLNISLLPGEKARIHFDVDLLAADVQSFQVILRDLARLYNGETLKANPNWSFGEYLEIVEKQTVKAREEAKRFWKEKIPDMPIGPKLPLQKAPEEIKNTTFTTRKAEFSKVQWEAIKQKAAKYQITPAMIFLTVYSEVLERWSETSRFLVNLPIFNRHTEFEGIEDVVADFSNILLLDVDCSKKQTFVERAKELQKSFHNDMGHIAYSGVEVTRELARYYPEEKCIAPVVFACNLGEPLLDDNFHKTFGKLNFMLSQTPQVWIDFQMFNYNEGLYIKWDAVEELFYEGMLDEMFKSCCEYIGKLSEIESDWNQVFSIDCLSKEVSDRNEKFNVEETTELTSMLEGFVNYAKQNPNKKAIIQGDTNETITYGELLEEVLKTGAYLQNVGVKPGDVIALSMERGIKQITGALGILAAGGCYTPIGLSQPEKRRKAMCYRANAQFVLTNIVSKKSLIEVEGVTILILEEKDKFMPLKEIVKQEANASSYIIFTSGSTGEPKGVEISHEGALNTIEIINKKCQVTDQDTVLAVSSMEFDLSVYDIFGMLNAGGRIVCIPEAERRNADFWVSMIKKHHVTVWNSVPILFDMLLVAAQSNATKLEELRWVFLSGDWIGLTLPERMKKQAPYSKMLAMGGATEASIWSNYFEVELPLDSEWKSIPYGYPLANQKYIIMDQSMRPCPSWKPGELWIGGKGVALSYINDLELTNQKFVMYEGERWYRTGDLGRYWKDGKIEFLGRMDFQVKIRGHRIELGEIENALLEHEGIEEVVVVAKQMASGQKELLAFIVTSHKDIEVSELKTYLTGKIPEYMVPKHYVNLLTLPISRNGKVDRKKLLQMSMSYEIIVEELKHKPETKLEKKLAEVWKLLLNQEEVFIEDSYFELGGNSLIATKLSAAIRQTFNVKFMIEDVFDCVTFTEQAQRIEELLQLQDEDQLVKNTENQIIVMDKEGRYKPFPMTEIQKAYWIGRKGIYDLGEVSTHYYFEIENEGFNITKFNRALDAFLRSHDMMHAVTLEDGENQIVLEEVPPYALMQYDLENLSDEEANEKIKAIREELTHRVFKPEEWPLFDIRVTKLSEDRTRLHLCFDNIIFDGYSIFFFFNEVNRMYEENQYEVKEPVITFRDYILAVEKLKESAAFKEDKKYWMDRLYTLPPAPELTIQEAQQHTFKHLEHRMSKDKWEKLQKYLSLKGITPSVFLITAYGEILATWSRRQKFTLNLTRFNRMALHPSINEVVGDFTSLTLLEMDMQSGNNCTFLERCKAIQKQLLSDLQHPLFCGVQMQRELGKVQSSRQGVLMPVVFTSSLGLQINEAKSKNWFENRVFSSSETPQVWLDHQVTEENGTLVLIWDYVKEIFPKNMIDKMFKAYIRLLDTLAEEFNYFNEVDSHMVALPEIEKFEAENQLNRPLLKETLNRLVKRQLKATPDNIAVIHNDKSLTYGELNEAVNKVANAILKEEKKKLIGIFMEKGIEQVVAVLGIMCSGAGYLPLDPHHPAERINNLLKEAGVDMILTQSWMNKEQVTAKSWINVDEVMKEEYISDMHLFQEIEVKPEDTAYVIYTSGSTGKPKGVAISHESAVNTIIDINKRFNVGEKDRCIALSNLNFDLSVYDIFGLLSVGGAIVIPQQKELKNPAHWLELLKEHSVSVWNTVPTFMNMLTEYMGNQGSYEMLRLVMLSGDWIPMSLPEEVKVIFPNSKFISLGGATEASIWSNYYIVEEMKDEWRSIPYGKPLTNQTLLIYNDRMQPCPIGICGELYIGGLGVAQGYWYDEDRTNERFIIHPITKERVYKTGDLACYMEDGNIEFLGREDHQVKIRGFRIELGEIENAINQSEEVKESIVIVEKEQQQLIAFMTPANIENEYTHEALRLEGNKVIAHIKAEMIKKENKQKTARLMKEINQVSAYGAVNLLKTLNINESMDGIDKRYIALVEQWFKQLEKLNIDVKELKQFTLQNYQDLSQEAQDLVAYYKDTQTIYEAILKGERDVISLFLDENFAQSLSKLDFYNNINSYYYNVLIELLDRYCSVEKANQTVKVLELGTRFGSLLEHIQKANLNKSWDYTYSDESKYFLKNKEEQYKNINFKVFDMNKPVEGQDISGEKYDVILADNSLHRAKNIDVVLENVKQLLSPEGVLLFVENTTMNCFDLNVAGLYEYGFSQYEDDRKEKQMPFYNCASWTKKLEQNNMETIAIFGAEENLDEVYNRCLYVVKSKQNTKAIHLEALTKLITASLPDYMVPKRYVVLSKLPITPNGKIDRKRLMSYVANSEEANQKEVVKPINEMEEFILKLWQDILQLETISTEDNFFEIGGDSLLAIQCMNRLVKKYMVDISLQEIFTVSSIHSLAGIILEKLALTEDMDEGEI